MIHFRGTLRFEIRSLQRLKRQLWPLLEALQKTCGSFVVMLANQKLMIETMQACHRPEKLSSLLFSCWLRNFHRLINNKTRCKSRKDHGTNFLTIPFFIDILHLRPSFYCGNKIHLASFPLFWCIFHQAQWKSSFVDQQSVFQDEPHSSGFRVWTASWGAEGGAVPGTPFRWWMKCLKRKQVIYCF